MGNPQAPTSPHLYPQALQLKLYQAFIFSIPILFSIILLLLFYLFYLKRRASTLSFPPQLLPISSNQAIPFIPSIDIKGELKDKLPIVLFDEELRTGDSQCCVCLGDFEIKEELLQIPSCKHIFHVDCIHHWLHTNSTCPLCRCSVIPTTKLLNPAPSTVSDIPRRQDNLDTNLHQQSIQLEQQQQLQVAANSSTEQVTIPIEDSSSGNTSLHSSGRLTESGNSDREPVVLHVQTQSS